MAITMKEGESLAAAEQRLTTERDRFGETTAELIARWAWYTPQARTVWTVVPPDGTRLRCRYEPPCDFHGQVGDSADMCRWLRRPVRRR